MHCALIATKPVYSASPFVVYSHTAGLIGEAQTLEEAGHLRDADLAKCRERGRESDALVFEWRNGGWQLCGTLYDHEASEPTVLVANI